MRCVLVISSLSMSVHPSPAVSHVRFCIAPTETPFLRGSDDGSKRSSINLETFHLQKGKDLGRSWMVLVCLGISWYVLVCLGMSDNGVCLNMSEQF